MTADEAVFQANVRTSKAEYLLRRVHLRSMPRVLGLVLGNACNIDCPHCYQAKNGDQLLKPEEIGRELRHEFMGFYPYLSTLRIQGGEVFAYRGFRDLVADVASTVRRPLVSVSTNGTLIYEGWAETIVRTPFLNVTVSIDGGTRETYARMRKGADLDLVLNNVQRIQRWKRKLNSDLPVLDTFFVILRSNFREIPQYLELAKNHGFADVTFQTVEINRENTAREPNLAANEVIAERTEVAELHAILRAVLPGARKQFRMVRLSGLESLFDRHGLESDFLLEKENGVYPDSDDLGGDTASVVVEERSNADPKARGDHQKPQLPASNPAGPFELCPNPWTTLFVAEQGNVHVCFLSEPVGNLYEAPLVSIWNSPRAIEKRQEMIAGRYVGSGCSPSWCGWRDGHACSPIDPERQMVLIRAATPRGLDKPSAMPTAFPDTELPRITSVRRAMALKNQRIADLEELHRHDDELQALAQKHIDHLEAKANKAVEDYRRIEQELEQLRCRAESSLSQQMIHIAIAFLTKCGGRLSRLFQRGRSW